MLPTVSSHSSLLSTYVYLTITPPPPTLHVVSLSQLIDSPPAALSLRSRVLPRGAGNRTVHRLSTIDDSRWRHPPPEPVEALGASALRWSTRWEKSLTRPTCAATCEVDDGGCCCVALRFNPPQRLPIPVLRKIANTLPTAQIAFDIHGAERSS